MLSVLAIYNRDGGICWICGIGVPLVPTRPGLKPTRDHAVPLRLHGTNHESNLRLAHASCNHGRDTRPASWHRARILGLLAEEPRDLRASLPDPRAPEYDGAYLYASESRVRYGAHVELAAAAPGSAVPHLGTRARPLSSVPRVAARLRVRFDWAEQNGAASPTIVKKRPVKPEKPRKIVGVLRNGVLMFMRNPCLVAW